MLGVRYIISDGALDGSSITEVMRETSAAEMMLRLYEIRNAIWETSARPRLLPPIATAMRFAFTKFASSGYSGLARLELLPSDLVPASQRV